MSATELAITRLSGSDLATGGDILRPPGTSGSAAVQVWVLDDEWLGLAERMFATTLSIEEQRRGAAFARRNDELRFRARRGLLRHLLSRYLDCEARDIHVLVDAHGKPALSSSAGPLLPFNVAQTDGATVLAFAGAAVGVDVQCRRPELNFDDIAAEVFSTGERTRLQSAAPQDRARCFFDTWARKEALLKALGIGLLTDAKQYTTQASETVPRWRAWRGDSELRSWTLLDLPLDNALHAAVAVQPRAA
ncbi:MAG TPA: 4'-phosphopantetheinyl transferase superfamily protein [Burkholderiaceae bacterium]|nr:4'-phosphopantetheinyl transferase superfamily protein [Burkholderiaceae bacterium]